MNFTSKKTVVVAVLITLLGLVVLLGTRRTKVRASEETPVPGSLEALAQDCLLNGIQVIDINAMLWEYNAVAGIDEALSKYSVVVAKPVSANSYVWSSERQIIGTWYKFVVTETLLQRPHITCAECSNDPPASLVPLTAGQFLVPKYGGSVTISGVTINSIDAGFPDYQLSQSYLLFVDIDQSKGVGIVHAGPAGVFSVGTNGTLTPVTSLGTALADDISVRYGNSLPALRAALGINPTPTPTPTSTPCFSSAMLVTRCINNGGDWDFSTCRCN